MCCVVDSCDCILAGRRVSGLMRSRGLFPVEEEMMP